MKTKVLVSGSSGLVGSALVRLLESSGNEVKRLVRSKDQGDGDRLYWNPEMGFSDLSAIEGLDAVVNLAGENIAARRWSAAQKTRIRDSRVLGTRRLCEALAKLNRPPAVLVNASAIGYYGNRGDEVMDETSQPGNTFLPTVCKDWEAATLPAADKGIRVVLLRLGVVLSPEGGALAKMLLPFKMGAGGVIGNGQQFMSWIALDDVARVIEFVLRNDSLKGPVNTVAPNPITNREFTKTLGKVLSRPTIFPMPAFVARLAFGEMADELLLSSTRVSPTRLLESGFQFRFPEPEPALRHLLGK